MGDANAEFDGPEASTEDDNGCDDCGSNELDDFDENTRERDVNIDWKDVRERMPSFHGKLHNTKHESATDDEENLDPLFTTR